MLEEGRKQRALSAGSAKSLDMNVKACWEMREGV